MARENEMKPDEPDWAYWFSYEGMLANPAKWLESADILTAALSFMRPILDRACKEINGGRAPQPRDNLSYLTLWTVPVFLMLAGFALENLFKGRTIQDNPGLIATSTSEKTAAKRLPEILRSHDLVTLAARTPVQLSESEKNLLRHLTAAAVWWGRYPVPRTSEGMQLQCDMFSRTVIAETMDTLQKVRDQLFPGVRSFAEINGIDPRWLGLEWAYRGWRGMPVQQR